MARLVSGAVGARVSIVQNADSALRLVAGATEVPSAILLDFELGAGGTGVELLMKLRSGGFRGPCAFSTGVPALASRTLREGGLGDSYPVFGKGASSNALIGWLGAVLGEPVGTHTSGVRRKTF